MPLEPSARDAWRLKLAWAAWLAVVALVVGRGVLRPEKNSCFHTHYREGGLSWYRGNDLYQRAADTCRYSPVIHAALVPFSVLPSPWDAALWRLAEAAALLGALAWWLRAVCSESLSKKQRAWLILLAIPLAIGSLNNGQSNVFMTAGILAGTAAVARQRWTFAAVALAFACFFKIYPVAVALVLIALYPRQLGVRFVLAVAVGLLVPFVLQDPGYVYRQYGRWFGNLGGDDRSMWPLYEAYRDAWLLVRLTGAPIDLTTYRIIQLAAGACIGLLCIWVRLRGDSGPELLNRALGLSCCWMLLFGPATESPTYILLSPTLAWLLVEAWRGALPKWTRWPIFLAAGLFFITCIAVTTPYGRAFLSRGTQPAAAMLIFGTLLAVTIGYPAREAAVPATLRLPPAEPKGVAA
jgi:hypothetical protein